MEFYATYNNISAISAPNREQYSLFIVVVTTAFNKNEKQKIPHCRNTFKIQ